ncbi:hypothetical protein ABZW44_32160 [Streptomyces mirabilis]|uniref:hypothetical protein n=1 Tax=Streptomyces mirabilis TaxID=68239 RepID=UPI0033BC5960
MTLQRVEVGLVSADEALVEFVAAVFELERLPAVRSGSGVVHRLEVPGTQIKVFLRGGLPPPNRSAPRLRDDASRSSWPGGVPLFPGKPAVSKSTPARFVVA